MHANVSGPHKKPLKQWDKNQEPPVCPVCHTKSVMSITKFGVTWVCRNEPGGKDCDTRVGCHKGTNIPLGTMAGAELRKFRSIAHDNFDFLWTHFIYELNITKHEARNETYNWLAEELKIPTKDCHIALFDIETCRRVAAICNPIKQKIKDELRNAKRKSCTN